MSCRFPEYLTLARENRGKGVPLESRTCGDMEALAHDMARVRADGAEIVLCVIGKVDHGRPARLIRNLAVVRGKETVAVVRIAGATFVLARPVWKRLGPGRSVFSRTRHAG